MIIFYCNCFLKKTEQLSNTAWTQDPGNLTQRSWATSDQYNICSTSKAALETSRRYPAMRQKGLWQSSERNYTEVSTILWLKLSASSVDTRL